MIMRREELSGREPQQTQLVELKKFFFSNEQRFINKKRNQV
jgi:hypothetical protein